MLGFAHVHAAGLARAVGQLPGAELAAIFDAEPERLNDAISLFDTKGYADVDELLRCDDINAVIVMSETLHHVSHVCEAAKAGKHVLCEKPIATTQAGALTMIEACQRFGVKFQTIFPMRFNRAALTFRQMIRDGAVGTPIAVKATNPGKKPLGWFGNQLLAGGGAVMDHTVHVADLLRWVFDQEITEVYAEVDTRIHPSAAVDDTALMMLKMSDGLTASLDASWSRPKAWPTWGGLTVQVIGDSGVLAMDAFGGHVHLIEDQGPSHEYLSLNDDANVALLQSFIDAIMNDSEPKITGEDGLRAMEVALCAYESARRHEPVACPDCLSS
ncbi:MAG: hypothetical protein QOJ59_1062 [Thermomicrobiales bacterium]|jgi:predicted dehydrogenase|nr:hypothetical protein [Thermomicrobiales bacterium]